MVPQKNTFILAVLLCHHLFLVSIGVACNAVFNFLTIPEWLNISPKEPVVRWQQLFLSYWKHVPTKRTTALCPGKSF